MKTETCKINELLASSMKYIIPLTGINILLLLQGIYGNTYLSAFDSIDGFRLIIAKIGILLGTILIMLVIYLLFRRNLEIRRRFLHLSITGFLFLIVVILFLEAIVSIFLVYQINPQIDMKQHFSNFLELARPILFVLIQLDLVFFPIFMECCRRNYYL